MKKVVEVIDNDSKEKNTNFENSNIKNNLNRTPKNTPLLQYNTLSEYKVDTKGLNKLHKSITSNITTLTEKITKNQKNIFSELLKTNISMESINKDNHAMNIEKIQIDNHIKNANNLKVQTNKLHLYSTVLIDKINKFEENLDKDFKNLINNFKSSQ